MQTTIDFLVAVKRVYQLTSDYQLAKKLGVSRQMVSEYMAGKRTLGEETAVKVAELLEMDWAYIVACIHAERSKEADSRRAWTARAKKLAPATLALLAGCALVLAPLPGLVPSAEAAAPTTIYYVKLLLAMFLLALASRRALPFPHE